ncbi:hypothetical protein SCA6_017256, partial [Theobroma cacao]
VTGISHMGLKFARPETGKNGNATLLLQHRMLAYLTATSFIRNLVSKKRRRMVVGGYDLDMSYITDRLLAMSFPAERMRAMYRNPLWQVKSVLEMRHQGHYKIYNLCIEEDYDPLHFHGRVEKFPFDDNHVPSLQMMKLFCESVHSWLSNDPKNIAVIHCMAGKGRTGLMVCAYLVYSGMLAEEALQLYAQKRTTNNEGVSSIRSLYQANVVMWGIGKIYFHFQGELEMDFQMSTCLHHAVENCDEFVFMTPLPQPLSSLWSQSSKRLVPWTITAILNCSLSKMKFISILSYLFFFIFSQDITTLTAQIPSQMYCPPVEVAKSCCREINKGYEVNSSPRYFLTFIEGEEEGNTSESEKPRVVVQMDTESPVLYQKTCLDYHFSKPVQVSGDVRVIFYQKMIGGRLFYACFNTAFIKNSLLQFTIRDLDKVGSTGRSICGPAFCMELLFGPANPKHSMSCSSDYDN